MSYMSRTENAHNVQKNETDVHTHRNVFEIM